MADGLFFEDVNVGDRMPALSKGPIMKLQHVLYAGASGDFNPLHTDDDFARSVGMKDGVITHGMLVMGFVGQAITNWVPRKCLRDFSVRFSGMTRPGSTVTITGTVREKKAQGGENIMVCDVVAQDEAGDVKVTGSFSAALPSRHG
jgi:acyl dehydratase